MLTKTADICRTGKGNDNGELRRISELLPLAESRVQAMPLEHYLSLAVIVLREQQHRASAYLLVQHNFCLIE